MKLYWIFFTLLQSVISDLLDDSFYTIIAPGLIKSHRNYTVAVTLNNVEDPCLISLAIQGSSLNLSQKVELRANETKLIQFKLPKLYDEDDYKLITEGLQGVTFKNETNLLVDSEAGPKVYIQTDKMFYDPSDMVQFRIIMLDEHTRPFHTQEPISLFIKDQHHQNPVKTYHNITLVSGVFEGKFQISQNPIIGLLLFEVQIRGKYDFTHTNTINISKFKLPKFNVHIQAPQHLKGILGLIKFEATIYATYHFGNYVTGNATAKLWDKTNKKLVAEKEFDVNVTAIIKFEFDYDHNIDELSLEVSITDKYSGITENSKFPISIHLGSFKIVVPNKEVEYFNNKPNRIKVHIGNWYGEPETDQCKPVQILSGWFLDSAYLNDEGIATFVLYEYNKNIPEHVVEYKDSGYRFFLYPQRVYDGGYFELKLLTTRPQLGAPVKIKVMSTDNIPYLVYIIISHSNIIHMEHVNLETPKKFYIINLNPSIEMVPQAYVFVYYMDNGYFRSSEIKIKFPHEFENKISIKAPELAIPGQKISLDITAQPGSYVGILAMDNNLFLRNGLHDIRRDLIFHDLYEDRSTIDENDEDQDGIPPGKLSGLKVLSNGRFTFLNDVEPEDPAYVSYGMPKHQPFYDKTWIFRSLIVNSSNTRLTIDAPDSSTMWRVTAFSINNVTGFGMTDKPSFISTKKPYRITLKLPYSIKLDEILVITVKLHNDLKPLLDSNITLYNDNNEFQFIDAPDDFSNLKSIQQVNNKNETKFAIKPLKTGDIRLRLLATNGLYIDTKEQKLKVLYDGVKQNYNEAIFEMTLDNETFSGKLIMKIPENTVNNTVQINLGVAGDILSPTMENFDKLIEMPIGFAESNMMNFAVGVLILQYLTSTGKHLQEMELVNKIKRQIEVSYLQQLSYRSSNGGYRAFVHSSNDEESIWLTAYVIRYFIKATKFNVTIEPEIIDSGLEYLKEQQLSDGSYSHNGYLFIPAMEDKYALTSFVLVTLLESRKYANKYRNIINKSVEYLESNLDNIEDIYNLALTATAFKCAGSKEYFNVFEKLLELSQENDLGQKWWSANDGCKEKDIELTSYIQLALLGAPIDNTPVLKWLIAQRNEFGGFQSTQDTVMGILTLIKLARYYQNTNDVNTTVLYKALDQDDKVIHTGSFNINAENLNKFQKQELPNTTRSLEYTINGSGYTFAQLSYAYNTPINSNYRNTQQTNFIIEPKINFTSAYLTNLEICFTYHSPQLKQNSSNTTNMIIMEINLPTGFQSNADYCMTMEEYNNLERIESKNDDTLIIFYFPSLKAFERNCVNIDMEKTSEIMDLQLGSIKMYNYYNTSQSEIVFYDIEK